MPRNQQIYQCDVLYVGPTGANPCTGKHFSLADFNAGPSDTTNGATGVNWVAELYRVQTANYSFDSTLRDVNQFGELASIDRIPLDPPVVNLDFSYYTSNFINESLIGLTVSKAGHSSQISAISGLLNNTTDGKNYFMRTVDEGNDNAGFVDTTSDVLGIGNGYISSYTAEGSVGNFPTATVRVEGLNMELVSASTGIRIPAVNPTDGSSITGWRFGLITPTQSYGGVAINADNNSLSVLRPGDITLNLGLGVGSGLVLESDMKAQSYNVSFDLRRRDLNKLGTKFAYAKVAEFPVIASMNVNAIIGDHQTGSLVEIVANNGTVNPIITIYKPGVARTRANIICEYQLKGAKLRSQEFTSSIGPSKSVNMVFESQIGGPQNNTVGLFLSGITV